MSGEDGLDQVAVHAIIVNNQKLDHASAPPAGIRSAPRRDNSQVQPNTEDAG
jgi:hypothetical protein